MSRRQKTDDIICAGCGHSIDETHAFFVHVRGTKDDYEMYHSECLKLVRKKKKRNDKKIKQDD